jgi:hypothetical protein
LFQLVFNGVSASPSGEWNDDDDFDVLSDGAP